MERDLRAVVRASVGEPERFEAVFEQYHRAIWAYLARRAGPDRADELAGDVFVAAFRRRASFDSSLGSVPAWLYGIAANVLCTALRTEARAARAFERCAGRRLIQEDGTHAVDDILTGRQQLEAVVAALAKLATKEREILLLYAWEQLSYADVAAAMGVEVGTVRSRLSRARARLRELVDGHGQQTSEPQPFAKETADD